MSRRSEMGPVEASIRPAEPSKKIKDRSKEKKALSDGMITKSAIIEQRGWTKTAIERFLGEPDKRKPNPHSKRGPELCLYALRRIKRAEKTKRFLAWKEGSGKRKASAQKGAETLRKKLMAHVETFDFSVCKLGFDEVTQRAIESYNDWQLETRRDPGSASLSSDKSFLDRITVNFIRHELSQYDALLNGLFGQRSQAEARQFVRQHIFEKIAEAYPELKDECASQLQRRLSEPDAPTPPPPATQEVFPT